MTLAAVAGLGRILGLALLVATSVPGSAAAASAEPASAETQVAVEGFAFTPSIVTVEAGTSVVWEVRKDPEQHTVTPRQAAAFEGSPQLFAGDDYAIQFLKPGRFDYFCTLHPFMTGTIVVEAPVATPAGSVATPGSSVATPGDSVATPGRSTDTPVGSALAASPSGQPSTPPAATNAVSASAPVPAGSSAGSPAPEPARDASGNLSAALIALLAVAVGGGLALALLARRRRPN